MRAEGLSASAIAAFRNSYADLVFPFHFYLYLMILIYLYANTQRSGSTGCIAESDITGVSSLPDLEADLRPVVTPNPALLQQTVVLKLNGGLGTG